ncbi:MAG: class I SAM-dependent methyltransferase [Acidobacteria bacterium]|nr:class I SAM-dependent methyltransferase [Acidobacteriota bacterium]
MPGDTRLLNRYIDELFRWNRRLRLTGFRDPAGFRRELLETTRAAAEGVAAYPWATGVDIGSGNGVVAVVLAARFPERRVVALEPNGKKCTFLRHVRRLLALDSLEVVPGRLEQYEAPDHGDRLLWALRATEISGGPLEAALKKRPGSFFLCFHGAGTPADLLMRQRFASWAREGSFPVAGTESPNALETGQKAVLCRVPA